METGNYNWPCVLMTSCTMFLDTLNLNGSILKEKHRQKKHGYEPEKFPIN